MRKLPIAVTLACLAALGGSALASAKRPTTSDRHRSRTAITLFAPLAELKLLDLGEPGFSLGDESVFSDDLLTRRDGSKVGSDGGVCTVVRVTDAATQSGIVKCNVGFQLAHGQITTQALLPVAHATLSGRHLEAITGGTGRYRGVTGEAKTSFLDPTTARIELSITS